jgi:hypothetical protein
LVKRNLAKVKIEGSNPFFRCGYQLMVSYLPSKQTIWVQFPLPALMVVCL